MSNFLHLLMLALDAQFVMDLLYKNLSSVVEVLEIERLMVDRNKARS